MTILRLAIGLTVSLALHAALAAVVGRSLDTTVAGIDPQSSAVTLVLIETQSDVEKEAAPSPAPGANGSEGGTDVEKAEPAKPVDEPPAQPETAEQPAERPDTTDIVKEIMEPEVAPAEKPAEKPQEMAALPVAPEATPSAEQAAEPAVTQSPELPETVAVIPRSRPSPETNDGKTSAKKPEKQAKSPPKPPAVESKTHRKTVKKPAPGGGRNSAGEGTAATAKSSARAIAAYGRRVNAHVARHRQAANGRGTVALTIRVNRSGRLVGASLSSSSGDAGLDKAALATARKAAPYPVPPQDVPGSVIALRIRLSYR